MLGSGGWASTERVEGVAPGRGVEKGGVSCKEMPLRDLGLARKRGCEEWSKCRNDIK